MGHGARIDPAAYFSRIGYCGPTSPTVDTLHAIALAHVTTLPFNNLDILLGRPIKLDDQSLQQKLVVEGRGGYCFEQNGLLMRVLTELGFEVTALGARARIQTPRHIAQPRTHLFLRVIVDAEPWLVDVGFGGLSLTSAIRLEIDSAQPTPHETRRITREGERYFHQARLGNVWSDAYEFTLSEMQQIDQVVANYWTSTNPDSRFTNRLIVARAGPNGTRLTISDKEFTIRQADGVGTRQVITSNRHLLAILNEHFGLRYSPATNFEIPGSPWSG